MLTKCRLTGRGMRGMGGFTAEMGGKTGMRKAVRSFTIFTDGKSCVIRHVFSPFVRGIK